MYKVTRTGDYGRLYSSKGLLQFHEEKRSSLIVEFDSLERARRYCKAFVRRYPQTRCNIFEGSNDNTPIEVFQDDKYWELKNINSEEWAKVNNKGQKLAQSLALIVLILVSVIFTLVAHALGIHGFSLWHKLIILPVLTIVTCKLFYWLFPKIF